MIMFDDFKYGLSDFVYVEPPKYNRRTVFISICNMLKENLKKRIFPLYEKNYTGVINNQIASMMDNIIFDTASHYGIYNGGGLIYGVELSKVFHIYHTPTMNNIIGGYIPKLKRIYPEPLSIDELCKVEVLQEYKLPNSEDIISLHQKETLVPQEDIHINYWKFK